MEHSSWLSILPWAVVAVCLTGFTTQVHAIPQDSTFNFTFNPPEIEEMFDHEEVNIEFNLTYSCCPGTNLSISIHAEDTAIVDVSKNSLLYLPEEPAGPELGFASGFFTVKGGRLGLTTLTFTAIANGDSDTSTKIIHEGYRVIVLRDRQIQDDVFRYGIISLSCILYVGFGCQLDLSVIWKILKRPVAPAIGFGCQFIIMPLLGFAVAKMLSLDDPYAFGLLTMACSPGGGASNVWSNLLRGDLDLSLTMTFISTLAALGMMPFWMFALGHFFIDQDRIDVPYLTIVRSLLVIVIPCIIGIIIRKIFPKIGPHVSKFTKPFSAFFVVFILTLGTYANWYMYVIMGTVPLVIPASILLPYIGFGLGALMAKIVCQPKSRIITIAIETGYQNASIPIIMLQGSFPQPEGDLGAVIAVATGLFTPIALYFASMGLLIHDKCVNKDTDDSQGTNSIDLNAVKDEGHINGGMVGVTEDEDKGKDISGPGDRSDIFEGSNVKVVPL